MPEARVTSSGYIGNMSVASTIYRAASGGITQELTLPAAKSGTLSARTNDSEGTLTLEAGHGIETGDVIDVYWDGGMRRNVDVGTVAGNDVPISGGAGDVLPAQDTALTAFRQQEIDTDFDGDLLEVLAALLGKRGRVAFHSAGGEQLSIDLVASEMWSWFSNRGVANPLAGVAVTHVIVTQAEISPAQFALGVLYDSQV